MALDAIVFLHGWTMRGAVFDDLIKRLDVDVPCYAPDLPGHGDSAGSEPSLEAAVRQVDRLLTRIEAQQVLLVGWSMGAAIAWSYIRTFGQNRLAGLMTVDMSPRLANAPDWPHGLYNQTEDSLQVTTLRMRENWDRSAQSIAANMYADASRAADYPPETAYAQVMSNDPAAMQRLWSDLANMDLRDVIPQISVPYLVAYGAKSRVYPESAALWLAKTARNGWSHAFEHSGHSPHLEEPEAFAQAVMSFI